MAFLFPYSNPLKSSVPEEFFKRLPREPGVYLMLGVSGSVLYVGKAKDLRARVRSYRLAHPENAARKVIRMLHLVREIRIETCASEKDALLRENALIREHRPHFNVVNTSPESYSFIGLRVIAPIETGGPGDAQVRLRITCSPKREGERLYGAFKSRRLLRDGYLALLRLLWATRADIDRFEFPAKLTRRSAPAIYTLKFAGELLVPLKRLLNGTGEELLVLLTAELLGNERIPPFYYAVVQRDLEALVAAYQGCFARNRELLRGQGLRRRIIAQDELDDLRVKELARLGKIQG